MKHTQILANCIGDKITAIGETLQLAKASGKEISLNFEEGFSIKVHPESYIMDLTKILKMNMELRRLKYK